MTYYYKRLDKDGKIIMIGTQSFPVTPNTEMGNEAITEEEYNALMEEIKSHSANVQDYVNKVKAGEIALADVPADYMAEVEAIINAPAPEEPNNPYGIPDETYEEIRQGVVSEIVEGVKNDGKQTEPTI